MTSYYITLFRGGFRMKISIILYILFDTVDAHVHSWKFFTFDVYIYDTYWQFFTVAGGCDQKLLLFL